MTGNKNLDTGMPPLPEGYFWRVKQATLLGSLIGYWVTIRKQGKRFSEHVWGNTYVALDSDKSHEELIYRSAWSKLEDWQASLTDRAKATLLTGDYPPKRLGE